MSHNKFAIELKSVTKKYTIHHYKPTLLESFLNHKLQTFTALKSVNLSIKHGEKVGIIGSNGSGKTTLLKMIAGITSPTLGSIRTHGRVISLIDLEAGFHPDLSGEENIHLNGMIIGMGKEQIKERLDNIIAFANIGRFIDTPLFTYSEGMKLRLGFSIAAYSNPDILILDENMAVGDREFKKASLKKIHEFYNQGKTIVIASHNLDYIRANCQRVIWLNKGIIKAMGEPGKIISKYVASKI